MVQLATFHNGFASIPKGSVDCGEDYEEAAKREVFEECGVLLSQIEPVGLFKAKHQVIHLFEGNCDEFGQALSRDEVMKIGWVEIEKLKQVKWAPGFKEIVEVLFDLDDTDGDQNQTSIKK